MGDLTFRQWVSDKENMATLQEQWVAKAEEDYICAAHFYRRREPKFSAHICFHCRELAQKYLIAYLIGRDVAASPQQDLLELVRECITLDPTLSQLSDDALAVTPYDEWVTYPHYSGKAVNAKEAMEAAGRIRKVMRQRMGVAGWNNGQDEQRSPPEYPGRYS